MARVAAAAAAILPVVLGGSLRATTDTLLNARNEFSRSLAGFKELGCYTDTKSRIFGEMTSSDEMTTTVCAVYCQEYPYYGLQNGDECWCGDYEASYDKYGEASNCDMDCSGNSDIHCGGRYAMQVFTQAEEDDSSLGCVGDDKNRVFTDQITSSDMSPEVCKAHCSGLGKFYYATQWGQECWCGEAGDDYDKYGSATCDRPCSGDPMTMCGGNYALTVYLTGEDAVVTEDYPCYADAPDDRVGLNMLKAEGTMTHEVCMAHCQDLGASWALLEYGHECFCGYEDTDVTRLGSATCGMPCEGDSLQACGGPNAVTAIAITGAGLAPVSPTPVTGVATPSPQVVVSPVEVSGPQGMPTSPETVVETIANSCTGDKSNIRWAAGTALGGRMYLEDGGCGTMTDLYLTRVEKDGMTAKGPIYVLDENDEMVLTPTEFTGKWLLTSELHVLRGSVFYCRGKGSVGGDGDCDELRIQSTGASDFHEVRGHGGSMYFENTIVTSWDTPNKVPQVEYENGRSFLNCVTEYESEETCVGQPKNDFGWCRMDIINSEMGYLGYFDSESYGLTWKVRGFCVDKSNPEVFETSNVFGDIIGSDIHHMYYGMYSYGHQGGVWTDNEMHDNYQYGFDPHDDSDYLTIARNTVYNNVNHGIIASKRCNNVEIYENKVFDGGAQAAGIFLHRSSDAAKVYDNVIYNMQDAGIAMLESFDAEIYNNNITDVKYGIRISLGGGNNYVHDNTFDSCTRYGMYTYKGSDLPEQTEDGRPGENQFVDNNILNTEVGVKIKEADNTVITGNTFTGTKQLEFFYGLATEWSDNSLPDDDELCVKMVTSDDGVEVPISSFTSSSGLPANC